MTKTLTLFTILGIAVLLYGGPGDAGAAFLRIPVDARVVGMGEAAVSYIDNASALYYNPAGMKYTQKLNLLFMHNAWLLGMNHEYLAGAFSVQKIGVFGIGFNYWGSGSIQGVTIRGDTIPGYYFSATNWAVNVGYAKGFKDFSLGFGFKYIAEKNESLSTSSFGVDIGMVYETPLKGLNIGLSCSNLGASVKLDEESFSLPIIARFGWKYSFKDLNIAQDFVFSNADKLGIALGAEYWIGQVMALRVGYRNGSDCGGISGLRAGFGVLLKGLGIDYGVAPYGKLGISHRISLNWKSI
ncbi:MAG: PorV/PorQ family protein [bacterium]